MVFTTISSNDFPIESLEEKYRNREAPVMRFLLRCLLFLPFIAALLMLVIDILSLLHLVGSPFRPGGYLPWEAKGMIHAGFIEAFGVVLMVIIASICYRITRFEDATGGILGEYFPTDYQSDDSSPNLIGSAR
jgi:TRAP-type mannitol/chloroaromatic compound transport system permease small subunit